MFQAESCFSDTVIGVGYDLLQGAYLHLKPTVGFLAGASAVLLLVGVVAYFLRSAPVSDEGSVMKPLASSSSQGGPRVPQSLPLNEEVTSSEEISNPPVISHGPLSSTSNETEKEAKYDALSEPPEKSLHPDPDVAEKPNSHPHLILWAGTGAAYLKVTQTGSEGSQFGNLVAPTKMLGMQLVLNSKIAIESQYESGPGHISVREDTLIDHTDYEWSNFLTELQWRIGEYDWGSYELLLGLQDHQLPILKFNGDGSLSLQKIELQNFSFGGALRVKADYGFEYQALLRAQTLLSSNSSNANEFKASGGTHFDGSLGLVRRYSNGVQVGAFWYGQSLTFDTVGSEQSGKQTFFESNIQFRLGYDFFGF